MYLCVFFYIDYMSNSSISIKGANVHNLKNIDVDIPRNKLIVITGLSGSGKSSLAFDTLYAEGQRRYVESLSAYARQFMGKLSKPEVELIKGIPPAVAIEQRVISKNPRSTVGTTTEIYEYLKLLFARIGKTYSPISGEEVKRETTRDVVNYLQTIPKNSRLYILSPISLISGRNWFEQLEIFKMQGFSRVVMNQSLIEIDQILSNKESKEYAEFYSSKSKVKLFLLIDRFKSERLKEHPQRVGDSIQTAFFEGKGTCVIQVENETITQRSFNNFFELDGIQFEEPIPHLFSFNNPYGACPECGGTGVVEGFSVDKIIPDKSKSVYGGAVSIWNSESLEPHKRRFINKSAALGFPIHRPIHELTQEQFLLLWEGDHEKDVFGVLDSLSGLKKNSSYHNHLMVARISGSTYCPKCRGKRLRDSALYVKVKGYSIWDMVNVPVKQLYPFFQQFEYESETEKKIAYQLVHEITSRLGFLNDVGLGYLTLDRNSKTLSGGESQRINLATSLGSSLVGSLYVLDEPSIGLHPRDTERLISVLKRLRDIGNTVVVVEHDEEMIKNADYIIDMGPMAGRLGGEVVFTGNYQQLIKESDHLTAQYMRGMNSLAGIAAPTGKETLTIPIPKIRRKWKNYIEVVDAVANNLKKITVKFPLDVLTVVTGVSGSGKSTLIKSELLNRVNNYFSGFEPKDKKDYNQLKITKSGLSEVLLIDQNPIGKSKRSNPATYLKIFDDIRNLYAQQPLAVQRNYKASYFSFNTEGGRCETCMGEGIIYVEMQFMADVELHCTECDGKRYKEEVLDIKIKDQTISDILNMTINQAYEFFTSLPKSRLITSIIEKITPLIEVGLGYLKMGQPSSTLSGGEAQRIKLASFLSKGTTDNKYLFIFDEPTTGLHFHDINNLYRAFNKLIEIGNSIIVIEHNTELIKCADWIIDLGPEGGDEGGSVVFEGTPEDLIHCEASYTAKYLKPKLS